MIWQRWCMTTATVESPPESAPSDAASPMFVVRVATVYLHVAHDHSGGAPDLGLAQRLKDALEEDSRVTNAVAPALDPGWSPHVYAYPGIDSVEDAVGVLDGQRHFHAQVFSEPINLDVHVPRKNQRTVFADDEIPAEDYHALWDGRSLLVAWEQSGDSHFSAAGGHVLEQVLETAAEKVALGIQVQACNPSCDFVFVHTDLVVVADPDATEWTAIPDEDLAVIYVTAPVEPELDAIANRVWLRYRGALRDFADMKNLGRQVLDLELVMRYTLDRLSSLHHARAAALNGPLRKRPAAIWHLRAWRRQSRLLLSSLWLGLGTLEYRKRRWSDARTQFMRSTHEADIGKLFELDATDEMDSIRNLDVSSIEASMEHAGSRLDASAVVLATLLGAVAGAVAGALVALLGG